MNAHDRYRVEQQPADGERPGLWAIRDTTTGELVRGSDGALELYSMKYAAQAWILREHGLGQSVMTRGRR